MILVAMQVAILGRQPEISIAELEALFGANKINKISQTCASVETDTPLPQNLLGGTIKSATLLKIVKSADLNTAFIEIQDLILQLQSDLPNGKLQFGVSIYGFEAKKDYLLKKMLGLKKIIKKSGRSVRIIENKQEELEAAQILYNKLTGRLGIELLIIKDGDDVILAKTTGVQDIDAYSQRDFDRPYRDTFVGMLPPKLAQIMLNLAIAQSYEPRVMSQEEPTQNSHLISHRSHDIVVIDPFCGTGVVLQEALLMGYGAWGSDLSEKMVDYSTKNLDWLGSKYQIPNTKYQIQQADATSHIWDFSKIQDLKSKIYVVCETYLGRPLTALPSQSELDSIMSEANAIAAGFLLNIAPQIPTGTKLCLALPAWSLGNGTFKHLKMLDQLTDMGYNRLEFVHCKDHQLIYHRPDQIVARELTVLERK